jgi:hypothetical protein
MKEMDELVFAVAGPFKKNAASSLSMKEFDFSLSFDLKWMSPDEASKLRERAVRLKLLVIEDGTLRPDFDIYAFDIPHGFKPSPSLFKELSDLDHIMAQIAGSTYLEMREIAARINAKQEELSYLVDIEIVALVVAQELGCDIEPIYQEVYDKIIHG